MKLKIKFEYFFSSFYFKRKLANQVVGQMVGIDEKTDKTVTAVDRTETKNLGCSNPKTARQISSRVTEYKDRQEAD